MKLQVRRAQRAATDLVPDHPRVGAVAEALPLALWAEPLLSVGKERLGGVFGATCGGVASANVFLSFLALGCHQTSERLPSPSLSEPQAGSFPRVMSGDLLA